MKYISVCSGIEAATVAWHPLGWTPLAFSEIEPFPCKVLAHHYPTIPNLGDMTKFKEWPDYANVDVLVGGTPCQSFSIAGLRKGLDDPRGNLMLTYLAIADKYRPTWVVWENVPGVLSSSSYVSPDPCPPPPPLDMECDGQEVGTEDEFDSEEVHAFNTFLAGLSELGYGYSYRVLDAQYVRTDGYPNAVPQRRRRVFVVGHLGSWQRAAAVLFDSESLRGNPPPRREAWKTVAGTIGSRTTGGGGLGTDFDLAGGLQVAPCMTSTRMQRIGERTGNDAVIPVCMSTGQAGAEIGIGIGIGTTLNCNHEAPIAFTTYGLPGNWIGRAPENGGNSVEPTIDVAPCQTNTDVHAVAFKIRGGCEGGGKGYLGSKESAFTLSTTHDQDVFTPQMQVRRLMPIECERLQGFPDNYTNIPGASDTTRYKSLGNSMACNVMSLIGQRIKMVSEIPLSK